MNVHNIQKILVSGDSMSPLYSNGDIILLDTQAYVEQHPVVGDIIVCKHPYIKDYLMIKQIADIQEDGRFFVLGINPDESTDSRSFGAILPSAVLGKVVGKENE